MARSGPSRACASFAPTMSVRIFGHFEQFSTFSARRAPCSAPSCTPDSWTNGPYMTWVLWTLVPMVHTPRGRSRAFVDPIGIVTTPGGMEIFGSQGHGSLCWTPGESRMEWRIRSPSWPGDILLGAPPNFGSFRAAKMTPFWDPNFTPRCGQLAAPYLYAHREPGPNFRLYTQI